jgi:hypothetical protein
MGASDVAHRAVTKIAHPADERRAHRTHPPPLSLGDCEVDHQTTEHCNGGHHPRPRNQSCQDPSDPQQQFGNSHECARGCPLVRIPRRAYTHAPAQFPSSAGHCHRLGEALRVVLLRKPVQLVCHSFEYKHRTEVAAPQRRTLLHFHCLGDENAHSAQLVHVESIPIDEQSACSALTVPTFAANGVNLNIAANASKYRLCWTLHVAGETKAASHESDSNADR